MYSALSTCSVELSLFFHNSFLEHYLAILVSTICAGSHGIFTIILPFHHYFSDLNIIIGFRISIFFQLSIFIVISLVWRLRCQTGQCRKYILNCLLILCFCCSLSDLQSIPRWSFHINKTADSCLGCPLLCEIPCCCKSIFRSFYLHLSLWLRIIFNYLFP